jgi:hypothetical protein
MNFCTTSDRSAPSFVRQPNGPECTQIEQNAPKRQFRVTWSGSDVFVAKNSDAISCTNFCTTSDRSAPSFVRQPNGPERTQIEKNAPKRLFRVTWGGSDVFVAKNSDATSCTNFSTSSARFALSFVRQQTVPNAHK